MFDERKGKPGINKQKSVELGGGSVEMIQWRSQREKRSRTAMAAGTCGGAEFAAGVQPAAWTVSGGGHCVRSHPQAAPWALSRMKVNAAEKQVRAFGKQPKKDPSQGNGSRETVSFSEGGQKTVKLQIRIPHPAKSPPRVKTTWTLQAWTTLLATGLSNTHFSPWLFLVV